MKITFLSSFLFCAVLSFSSTVVNAQQQVSGTVKSHDGESLVNAVVIFGSLPDTVKRYPTVCDANGFLRSSFPMESIAIPLCLWGRSMVRTLVVFWFRPKCQFKGYYY